MTIQLLAFVAGLAALYWGAEWLVEGASRLARGYGISPAIVGLTVVAFGTSTPELVVSVLAAARGNGALAVGNVVGSNIANLALILGVSALIRPVAARRPLLLRDLPVMIGLGGVFLLLGADGRISPAEGGLLLAAFAAYLGLLLWEVRSGAAPGWLASERVEGDRSARSILLALAGLAGLVAGAQLLVGAAVVIARALGASEVVIGLTLVAIGTSVPELATSVVGALRGRAELVLGNVVGSNIFNTSLVLGASALPGSLPISPAVLRVEAPLMIGFGLLVLPFALTRRRIGRWEGGALLVGYMAFVALIVA